jgi:hypothetical protein
LNGKDAPSAITNSPGQWSTGEFGSNLRAIFDLHNQAVFEFSGVNTLNGQAAWVFSYRIVKQNDPLWRLHTEDRVIAPPYIPKDFPSPSADLQTDNENISFADGTSFALPVAASIATPATRGRV